MADTVFAQESTDCTTEKIQATKNVIHVFTGQPPKDYEHIHDVKTLIEGFPHPNVRTNPSGTLPVGSGDVWNRMTDWNQLTVAEQTSVKAFLLEKFSVEDLELAYDEYYPRFGTLPTVHDYRVFILNWEAEMKADLETKDINIDQLTNRETNLRLALDFAVNHSVNQGEQIDSLVRDVGNLQEEKEQIVAANNYLSNSNRQLIQDNRQLSQDNSTKDRVIMQKERSNHYLKKDIEKKNVICSELKTKNRELKTENTQLQTENTHKDETINHLQTENTQLQTENTHKDETINHQQSEISQLQTENTHKDETINHLQTENTHKDETINHLQTENTHKDDTINHLQTENTHKDDTINLFQTENTHKDETINHLQTENTQLQTEKKQVKQETRNLKRDNSILLDTLKQQKELCNNKDTEIKKQKLKMDELHHEMSIKDDRISTLESVIDNNRVEIDRLVIDNRHKDQHIKEQDNVINDLRERLQNQEEINQDLYSQIAELRQLVLQQLAAAES